MNEFEIVKKYLKPLTYKNSGALELNDDIFFDYNKNIAVSVDTYVDGIHFLYSKNPELFLKKILRATLSDIYAKGIKPKKYFLSFSIKKNLINKNWLSKVRKILFNEQKKYGISISGGDITKSSQFIITILTITTTPY